MLVTSVPARTRRTESQLRVRRLGARLPGRARGRLPRAHQHGGQPGPRLAGASISCSPTRRRAISRAGWSSATSIARRLRIPARARTFTYPVYMVYPEARDEEAYEPILVGLRRAAERLI